MKRGLSTSAPGKSEFQFFGFPDSWRGLLDAFEAPGQGGQTAHSCRVHDYVGVRFDDELSWTPWFQAIRGKAAGAFSVALRQHAPGNLPGAAKMLLVCRVEAAALWGAEFLLESPNWPSWAVDLNRLQVGGGRRCSSFMTHRLVGTGF